MRPLFLPYIRAMVAGLTTLAVIVSALILYRQYTFVATPASGPLSRQVMAYAETQVATRRVPPPLAALQYAYIASAYRGGFEVAGQPGALYAATQLLDLFYAPATSILPIVTKLAYDNHLVLYRNTAAVPARVQAVIQAYSNRYAHDGHDLTWDGIIPTGPGKWTKTTVVPPVSPRAGDWQRWVVSRPIVVPAPPVLGSAEDTQELFTVQQAVAARNGEDINEINFWAGSIGTETPSGIWQNQLFATTQKRLPGDAQQADVTYSLIQKNLAQTLSDAFMECCKVKYTYWTARPDQRMPGLETGMPDPNFPGYVSGHSTVSKAAADVLGIMVPGYQSQWQAMAGQARRSRLVAGIHFDVDNRVGFTLGDGVAAQAATQLHLIREL